MAEENWLEDLRGLPDGSEQKKQLTLRLKKRRRSMIVKKMLEDAGYQDLAKIARISTTEGESDG